MGGCRAPLCECVVPACLPAGLSRARLPALHASPDPPVAAPSPTRPPPSSRLLQRTINPNIAVFKEQQCEPCKTGTLCPGGVQADCPAGTYTELVGSNSCLTCPDGTASEPGELR